MIFLFFVSTSTTRYSILLAEKLNVDLKTIVLDKLEISKKKYPVEKCKGSCSKYTEL